MDILPFLEAVDHGRVLREMSQKAQLNLRVVARYDIVIALAGNEDGPYLAALFSPDGDILQVGIGTAETARCRHHLVEMGMDTSCFRRNERFQPVEIGRDELLQGPEAEDLINHGMLI